MLLVDVVVWCDDFRILEKLDTVIAAVGCVREMTEKMQTINFSSLTKRDDEIIIRKYYRQRERLGLCV